MKPTRLVSLVFALAAACGPSPQVAFEAVTCTRVGTSGANDVYEIAATATLAGAEGNDVVIGLESCGELATWAFASQCGAWSYVGSSTCVRAEGNPVSATMVTTIGNVQVQGGSSALCYVVGSQHEPVDPGIAKPVVASARAGVSCD